MNFLSDNGGESYNLCHCACLSPSLPLNRRRIYIAVLVWSNFEIADMDFWRGPAYTAFFEFLESRGGFYYEVRLPFPLSHLSPL